ncbi:MAG: amidase [Rhodospirillaceae bacterium]|nr:amidase [Rhodospirillaceae bacterium]MBT5037611.1 amidase [Rhodospirillaceae bacterium]MBT7292064.1 amidase [Rhodospirillaceae bacterium]
MTIRRPSRENLKDISERHHLHLTEAELETYYDIVGGVMESYDALDQIPDPVRPLTEAIRQVGARPEPEDDPLNGVVRLCSVKAVNPGNGALAGKTIGLKDTISIAGIPMTCASRLLWDYTPDGDATVVKRLIEADGHITHILSTDDFGFAGTGHTSGYGPAKNPVNPKHHPGGSSSGSAIGIAEGLVDLTLGGDQGGSIRIPAAWSGIVGLKPSHGLIPYTGIVGFDLSIDHIGPMTKTVADTALMLSVLAGADDTCIDPRQPSTVGPQDYLGALEGSAKGLKVAVVEESFGHEGVSTREVDSAVRDAAERLKSLGAEVESVSIPYHLRGLPIWNAVAIEGATDNLYHGGHVYQHKGAYNPRFMTHLARAIETNGGDFSPTAKMGILVGHYMREQYQGAFYARAQNMARVLSSEYDKVLATHDLMLMPTTPQQAHALLPPVEIDRMTYVANALNMVHNTAPINLTGHPSISVPCQGVSGLPVGLMLTGRWMDDATVLRAANAYMTE